MMRNSSAALSISDITSLTSATMACTRLPVSMSEQSNWSGGARRPLAAARHTAPGRTEM